MSEVIEKARLSVQNGWKGIVSAFLILLFLSYNFIWAIIEPLDVPKYFAKCETTFIYSRAFLHIAVSFAFSLIATSYLYKKVIHYLEKLSLDSSDTNLQNCWTLTEGEPLLNIMRDGYFGEVLQVSGTNHYALDYIVKPKAHKSTLVDYIVSPENNFVLYLKVKLAKKENSEISSKWIAFVISTASPNPQPLGDGKFEWSFPATPHYLSGDWMRFSINIPKAINETYGNAEWRYLSLEKIRIRGSALIQSINLH